jgi:hypothetical protein
MTIFRSEMRARGTWKAINTSTSFTGVSSHSVTALSPGVVIICGGEDGPRTLVPPIRSLWKYEKEALTLVPQEDLRAVTLLGHCSFSVNDCLHVCEHSLFLPVFFFALFLTRYKSEVGEEDPWAKVTI